LDDLGKLKIRALSGGMRRRLGIAQAILHDPQVLIVDEPTAGLDPEERVRFRELLGELAAERVVLLSTHITEDVEKTCENLGILEKGKLIYHGSLASFTQGFNSLEAAYLHRIGGVAP
jgi:ABC-2 type transport system ATP-binding protein